MKIREFLPSDAERIISWIDNEREFRTWSADRYDRYPAVAEDIIRQYSGCLEGGRFFPLTAIDENGETMGHFILRYPNADNSVMRLGFVILDKSKRGKGIGCEMIGLAKKYASEVLHAQKLTLGVFENNVAAVNCYAAAGFTPVGDSGTLEFFGEKWKCIEMEADL